MQNKIDLNSFSRIVLVGGGTGGHIQPIISITKIIKTNKLHKYQDNDIVWIGGVDSQEQKAAKTENINFESIPILKLATTRSFKILLYPFFLILGILRARTILTNYAKGGNIGVFSKGGPGSVAVGLAAWSLGIPLYIHESDTIPGRSNRILGKFATKIWLGFESTKAYFDTKKCETIGQILDPIFTSKSSNNDSIIRWKTNKPHILVICGSQGSTVIFEKIIHQFSGTHKYEWIIVLGKLNTHMRSEFLNMPDCQVLDWISQSDLAYLIPDTNIAITRGSATTLAELTAFDHSPHLIIIPLPYSASNHQYENALVYQGMGHTLLEQKNIHQLYTLLKSYDRK